MDVVPAGVQRFVEHFPETFLATAPDSGQEDIE
jgi:hypothetical protein